ncbi:Chromosome partition protein Smc [invertebrate metagenome]|uniref:Chromosome partition protein Smc n=1 Tax=invertebrate metagenome TaxID=1711999 RepID=A0A2H9T6E7_9ZZZZ
MPQSLETRVSILEGKCETMFQTVQHLAEIVTETHQIMLENQRENRLRFQQMDKRFDQLERRMDSLEQRMDKLEQRMDKVEQRMDHLEQRVEQNTASIAALAEATYAGFKRTDEKIDHLELLIRQLLPNANN